LKAGKELDQMTIKTRVLVADDDPITRELLGSTLTRAGYEVIFAQDGVTAIEMASSDEPALVILDGLLPKMHGFLACKLIKGLPLPPKVILLTGVYKKLTYKYEVMKEYGADDFLIKPFKVADVLASVQKNLQEPVSPDRAIGEALCNAQWVKPGS
jgi:two-component system response regulator MtrA